ncbi:uncharacterized protein TNCV_1602791 [Trichonephila clavipes]|nr:uncharacterized protein TNCV_1602791 [Trichonephila clavipes]
MFFDYSYNQLSPSNQFMSLNVEESEVMRLRRLMYENILKVEKENLESVHKELSSQKETAIKSSENNNIQKKVTKPSNTQSSLSSKVKSATSKRLKSVLSKQTEVKKVSTVQLPIVNSDHVCKNSHKDCQFSSIHFLNHFHSSFISTKTQASLHTYDAKEKYTPCAVPLAPPSQEKELSILAQKPVSNRDSSAFSNNVVHHLLYEPKKLTIQTLPSITIIGKRPSSNENIKIEQIKERDYFIGDCIKTTILPALSKEVKDRISSTNLSQLNEISPSKIENTQVRTYHLKKSVFTQSSIQDEKSTEMKPDGQYLKEMIKEALHELQVSHPKETTCEHTTQHDLPSARKEQNGISPCNDCELDSFIGNANLFERGATSVITPPLPPPTTTTTSTVNSNCTQTSNESFHLHHALLDEKNVKRLIHEVISEYQQVSPTKLYSNKETNVAFDVEKADCEVQTSTEKEITGQDITSNIHKEVQTSPISEKPNEILEILEMNRFSDSNNKEGNREANPDSNENPNPLNTIHQEGANIIPEAVVSSELSSRLETVLNFIYNRFCKETGELSFNIERDPQSNTTLVQTREVSVQIHPASSSTKSTNTSEVGRMDAINQCEIILREEKNLEKDIKNASVQVTPIAEVILPTQEKVNSSVQCEQPDPILRNSCVQTMEFLATSENSANTSISSTPVSDSIFLDDMLSEGEIPWHLSLFSYTDKAAAQSSNNTPGTSDKEKDYSLSEGEIPPMYLQHLNLIRSPSYDSSSDTDPPRYPLTLPPWMQRSEGEINPETHQPFSSSGCHCHCRTSNSSLSEGEIRVSNSHLSEGEVLSTFLRQKFEIPPTLHPQNFGAISSISPCESRHTPENIYSSGMNSFKKDSFQKENLAHSSMDLSEGGLEKSQIPYQSTPCSSFLDAVAEEK